MHTKILRNKLLSNLFCAKSLTVIVTFWDLAMVMLPKKLHTCIRYFQPQLDIMAPQLYNMKPLRHPFPWLLGNRTSIQTWHQHISWSSTWYPGWLFSDMSRDLLEPWKQKKIFKTYFHACQEVKFTRFVFFNICIPTFSICRWYSPNLVNASCAVALSLTPMEHKVSPKSNLEEG